MTKTTDIQMHLRAGEASAILDIKSEDLDFAVKHLRRMEARISDTLFIMGYRAVVNQYDEWVHGVDDYLPDHIGPMDDRWEDGYLPGSGENMYDDSYIAYLNS
jgi:hypothetical protein